MQVVAVKTEPKMEPSSDSSQYSLADLDSITDLLPIQTGDTKETCLTYVSYCFTLFYKVFHKTSKKREVSLTLI